jgi:hypothetical protein
MNKSGAMDYVPFKQLNKAAAFDSNFSAPQIED